MVVYYFYRIENFFYKIKLIPIAFLLNLFMKIFFSCDIPYSTKIGKNTFFPHHGLGVVIHKGVCIGDNCIILQHTTIGEKKGNAIVPIIGNNVYVGANSCIIGPILIGDNSVVGAGSVVVKNIPKNEVWAGNPAKKIK